MHFGRLESHGVTRCRLWSGGEGGHHPTSTGDGGHGGDGAGEEARHPLLLGPGVDGGNVVVEHHQEEEGDAQHVGEDGELHVSDHPVCKQQNIEKYYFVINSSGFMTISVEAKRHRSMEEHLVLTHSQILNISNKLLS